MGSTTRLITSVGVASYRNTLYRWQGVTEESPYPSVALVRLLKLQRGIATILLTEDAAEKHSSPLLEAFENVGWTVEFHEVPAGFTDEEQMDIVARIMDAVRPNEAIVLDVTQGLRHLPFVYLAALTYLVELQGNQLTGIYYGAYELKGKDPEGAAPILDLTRLYRLLEWYQAFGAARETGDLRPVTRELRRDRGVLFKQGQGDHKFGKAADAIAGLARTLAMGTPLEIGLAAHKALVALNDLQPKQVPWPSAQRALEWFRLELDRGQWGRPIAFTEGNRDQARPRKECVSLTRAELERQLELAQWYADRYDFVRTALLLREWLVNAAVLAYGDPKRWLNPSERHEAERRLHALERQLAENLVTKDQAILGHLWQKVRKMRNHLAHVGMRLEEIRLPEPEQVARENLEACRAVLHQISHPLKWPLTQKGRLVITPLGLKPGLLFTACRRLRPDRLLILTSHQGAHAIDETLDAAGSAELERQVLLLDDPFMDNKAPKSLLDDDVRRWLASASEVVVNVTGGTSFMGYVVQQLALEAQRYGQTVRWCVLVDRRSDTVQREEPYVEGEVHWLRSWQEQKEAPENHGE